MSFLSRQNQEDSLATNNLVYIVIKKQDIIQTSFDFTSVIKGVYNYFPTFFELNKDFEILGPFQTQKRTPMFDPSIPPRRLSSLGTSNIFQNPPNVFLTQFKNNANVSE